MHPVIGFNPLAGIRCIQTNKLLKKMVSYGYVSIPWRGFVVFRPTMVRSQILALLSRFNPLAGIRCIQTGFSTEDLVIYLTSFNPLAGIRCIQTQSLALCPVTLVIVSIPWRGFVVFRHKLQDLVG